MVASLCLGLAYAAQLAAKSLLANRYAARLRANEAVSAPGATAREGSSGVSILQPILSGDPDLENALETNLVRLPEVRFFWLVDMDDEVAAKLCQSLVTRHPNTSITVLLCPPPPQGVNPKVHKLAVALDRVDTAAFVVLDDDTRLSRAGLSALLEGLDGGATLSTGLPRYRPAVGRASAWLAEFVNSGAVLTYLPLLSFRDPISIHGMCYAMRTETARQMRLFERILRSLTDDLALALELQRRGLRIHQTIQPHDIATSVPTFTALATILQRWFLFTRLLLAETSAATRWSITLLYGLPPLFLIAVLALAPSSTGALAVALGMVVFRHGMIQRTKQTFLGSGTGSGAIVSLLMEMAQPFFLVWACLKRTIRWRKRSIRVRSALEFEYL